MIETRCLGPVDEIRGGEEIALARLLFIIRMAWNEAKTMSHWDGQTKKTMQLIGPPANGMNFPSPTATSTVVLDVLSVQWFTRQIFLRWGRLFQATRTKR